MKKKATMMEKKAWLGGHFVDFLDVNGHDHRRRLFVVDAGIAVPGFSIEPSMMQFHPDAAGFLANTVPPASVIQGFLP